MNSHLVVLALLVILFIGTEAAKKAGPNKNSVSKKASSNTTTNPEKKPAEESSKTDSKPTEETSDNSIWNIKPDEIKKKTKLTVEAVISRITFLTMIGSAIIGLFAQLYGFMTSSKSIEKASKRDSPFWEKVLNTCLGLLAMTLVLMALKGYLMFVFMGALVLSCLGIAGYLTHSMASKSSLKVSDVANKFSSLFPPKNRGHNWCIAESSFLVGPSTAGASASICPHRGSVGSNTQDMIPNLVPLLFLSLFFGYVLSSSSELDIKSFIGAANTAKGWGERVSEKLAPYLDKLREVFKFSAIFTSIWATITAAFPFIADVRTVATVLTVGKLEGPMEKFKKFCEQTQVRWMLAAAFFTVGTIILTPYLSLFTSAFLMAIVVAVVMVRLQFRSLFGSRKEKPESNEPA